MGGRTRGRYSRHASQETFSSAPESIAVPIVNWFQVMGLMGSRRAVPSRLFIRLNPDRTRIRTWAEDKQTYAEVTLVLSLSDDLPEHATRDVDVGAQRSDVHLTPREIEAVTWMARGKTYPEIAILLSVAESTAKAHIVSVCHKLDAMNKTHAVALALANGLIKF